MSEESQMSEAQQLAHDRQAMSALAPKLPRAALPTCWTSPDQMQPGRRFWRSTGP
ncbi:hypothetical protein [Mycobacterium sp. NPDC050853]|uniref:hypothetical protein n=1 Tax=Mycobacterium sp. NPDC050853 TaxID=3155160 RepID=UPI0033D5E07F